MCVAAYSCGPGVRSANGIERRPSIAVARPTRGTHLSCQSARRSGGMRHRRSGDQRTPQQQLGHQQPSRQFVIDPITTPTATPSAQIVQGATLEQALADLAGAITPARSTPNSRRISAGCWPLSRPAILITRTPSRVPRPQTGPRPHPDRKLSRWTRHFPYWSRRESAAARSHAKAALDSSGSVALLWASMSVAASSYAWALGHEEAVPIASSKRRQLPALSADQAVAELVAQLHALVYGYQLAIGKLPVLGKRHARAVAELLRVRILRERLITILTRRSITVPVPQSAYVPSLRVSRRGQR